MVDTHTIGAGWSAEISPDGAELVSLRDGDGADLLWDAGPLWPNHSPVLFPIVGQVAGDRLRVADRDYPLMRHGFARRRRFAWLERTPTSCRLELRDDDGTRAAFPFPFRLELAYRVDPDGLTVSYIVANPGDATLPASLGAHPAFRWPLRGGAPTEYRLEFAEPEPDSIHRLAGGLMDAAPRPSPMAGRTLSLDPALFAEDAIIMLSPRSRSLRYVGPQGGLEFAWDGFPQLGLWQKPGAPFLCIEPWHGYSSPADWDGEFPDKPGLFHVPPGGARRFSWSVRTC